MRVFLLILKEEDNSPATKKWRNVGDKSEQLVERSFLTNGIEFLGEFACEDREPKGFQ